MQMLQDEQPRFSNADQWTISLRRCAIRAGRIVPFGETEKLPLQKAIGKLAPSQNAEARMNVLRARPGCFVGLFKTGKNFLLVNPTSDGNIAWLLKKVPDFQVLVADVCRVEDVNIPQTAIDLPPLGFPEGGQ